MHRRSIEMQYFTIDNHKIAKKNLLLPAAFDDLHGQLLSPK
jgi:hypothetical protein